MEISSAGSPLTSAQDNEQRNQMMTSLNDQQQEAIALKKALEWELSLDSRDLRSHAWYHGSLPRQRAEEIVQKDGDFLIRDCASQPDNYVLTCYSRGNVLHFVINKILLQPETVYERVQYQFEEDAFDAVPDLITFYVGSGKPISAASGARIQYPCNRYYPLSFYGHKIVGNQLHTQLLAGLRGANALKSPISSNEEFHEQLEKQNEQMSSPPIVKSETPPKLPMKKPNNQSLVMAKKSENGEAALHNNADHVNGTAKGLPYKLMLANGFQTIARCNNATEPVDQFKFTTHSLPRTTANILRNGISHIRRNGLLQLENSFERNSCSFDEEHISELAECAPSPPPKPARIPNMLTIKDKSQQQGAHYRGSGSDSGNGSGDSLQGSLPNDINNGDQGLHRGVIIKNPRFMSNSISSATLKSLNEFDAAAVEEQLFSLEMPEYKPESRFDIENYTTLLLPVVDNKPLDGDALNTFKVMLLESGPKVIAEHLTRIDIGLLIGQLNTHTAVNDTEQETTEQTTAQQVLDCCGLDMLTLPQGKIFREDLIERTQCLKLMVAVTILTCHTDYDRAELLSRWIQIAVETKTAVGNLFGFCAIMLGLCMQQIQKLDQAWHILRQKFTDSAFSFEAKLRPTLLSMNECSNPQAPNTTVPHVLPYILLRDRPIFDLLSSSVGEKNTLYNVCITSWESRADDFGMGIHFLHLDSVRNFLQHLGQFRKNSKLLLDESSSRIDELLSDAFRTEFHVKFLWGSIGATATAEDRHSKLEKVLAIMADKFASADQQLNQ